MPRYRPDTPAAQLRDAPARARRRTRRRVGVALASYLAVGVAVVVALAHTAPGGSPGGRLGPGAESHAAVSRDGTAEVGGASSHAPASSVDGHVADPDRLVRPVPAGWVRVGPLLRNAVADAASQGHEVAACVLAIDSPDERLVCAGDDEPRYAASVIKVAFAVGALEAWEGDVEAPTPHGRLGDLLDAALTVSDNDAANLLYDLSVTGPDAPATDDPVVALNAIADRVGLAERFHTGGAFRYESTGDWSRVSARGSVEYLTELVRAADGRAPRGTALTSPAVARTVLDTMLRQERRWKLPGLLPEGTVANKTGETDTESHDIAVVNTASGRYAIAVIGSASGRFAGPDEVMTNLGSDVVAALGGAARF
ncbi:class A beta-lactamase-related serine hydrolase [Dietzia cinnamea]|uniref:class A beta-lactamase-related serine hydrolase n=1 Tax=Dietzia cinnamea TaxID=321318 RepID=UPI00223B3B5E|nr:class A beta-lactamase-related serine hydrolase [Dietzia cinnamea]MCT2264210.1 class A beta-lactamase-related serine hydrolase [Dietzia cinnamea]